MFTAPTLWWDRHRGKYVSRCEDSFNLSPAYVTVATVKRMIDGGLAVPLPEGYDARLLGQLAWRLGGYGEEIDLTAKQGGEIASIAQTVIDAWADELDWPGDLAKFQDAARIMGDRPE